MYEKLENGIVLNWRYLLGDIISLEIALITAYLLRHSIGGVSNAQYYYILGLFAPLLTLFIIFFYDNYRDITRRGFFVEFLRTTSFVVHTFFILLVFFFALRISVDFSRLLISIWFIMALTLMYITRIITKQYIRTHRPSKYIKRLFLISSPQRVVGAIEKLKDSHQNGYDLVKVGVVGDDKDNVDGQYIRGKEDILNYILDNPIDEVLISGFQNSKEINSLINDINSMGVTTHFNIYDLFKGINSAHVQKIMGQNVLTSYINVTSDRDLFIKRCFDILGAIVGLTFTLILVIIIGPIIYFTSPGPIIFKQTRVGKNGRYFNFYKFRSMYADAEERKKELMKHNEMDGHMFKMKDDPRITPIGKFIRKTSLDEFPQFWNVLIGDMSLVGTRPPTVDEYVKYEMHHKARLAMKPGLTGMWQASGRSEITDFEEVVELDREYINNWSLAMDARLIVRTVKLVLLRKGAK